MVGAPANRWRAVRAAGLRTQAHAHFTIPAIPEVDHLFRTGERIMMGEQVRPTSRLTTPPKSVAERARMFFSIRQRDGAVRLTERAIRVAACAFQRTRTSAVTGALEWDKRDARSAAHIG